MSNSWCAMIHGGMWLNFKGPTIKVGHCCLRPTTWTLDNHDPWNHPSLVPLRQFNLTDQWEKNCSNCELLEQSGQVSFRQGMNQGLTVNGQGPSRLDLMFDISCNLACRICGPESSTFWQKHLQQNGMWQSKILKPKKTQQAIDVLSRMDLSNLQQLVFCGGETLLGSTHWELVEWLANNVRTAGKQLTLCFQTNGTQSIPKKYFDLIEKFHLIRLHVSLDGIGPRFEYMRWPASWNQVVDNLLELKQNLPSNVMFLVEETVSIFNLFYLNELETWLRQNFSINREGDPIDHTRHLAHGIYNIENCSTEYRKAMFDTQYGSMIPAQSAQDSVLKKMLDEIKTFDNFRGQKFQQVFPEVYEFYRDLST